jgi:dipeptidyl aminopeptidase/acylaminoacyl peptidase
LDSRIWTVKADGAGAKIVSFADGDGNSVHMDPAWSPDGSRIAFLNIVGGDFNRIWIVNADGTHLHQILDRAIEDPAWSPNGRWIAFVGYGIHRDFEIYVMRPDGRDIHVVTDINEPGIPVEPNVPRSPQWSPDGATLLFVMGGDLWTVSPAGGSPTNITSTPDTAESLATWSPDGMRLTATQGPINGGDDDVVVMDADGSNVTNLTNNDSPSESWPDWQPTCTIVGTTGADLLTGTDGNDVMCGLGGDDSVAAGAGDDVVFGGSGSDVVSGGEGDDVVNGGLGTDSAFGGAGADLVAAQPGAPEDVLRGGAGVDDLETRDHSGGDRVDGGDQRDTCVFDRRDVASGCP